MENMQYRISSKINELHPFTPFLSIKQNQFTGINYRVRHTMSMDRIVILGSSGSGKSTLARQLGSVLNLPVIHLDKYYWHSGWIGTPDEEWRQQVAALITGDKWIVDGNYRKTLNLRLKNADTLIFLDLPRWVCVWRAMKRRLQYVNRPRPDMAEGCVEKILDPYFPQFVRGIWDYPNRARPRIMHQIKTFKIDNNVIWLRSTKDVNQFLANPHQYKCNHSKQRSNLARFPQTDP